MFDVYFCIKSILALTQAISFDKYITYTYTLTLKLFIPSQGGRLNA